VILRIGVDLGGTKIEIIALDQVGLVLCRERIPTPVGDYTATVQAITDLVNAVETRLGARGSVGVGCPGALSPASDLMKNANSTCLIGQPLNRDLSKALARPIRIANDANCLALSEAVDGVAAGKGVVFSVILGTGVGGGLVVDGRAVTGRHAIGGEWGHNPLPWPNDEERPGPDCYCGKTGCIETFLSGPGLAADFERNSGITSDAESIVADADADNPAAEAAMARYADRLARSLSSVINILDPDVIVLGGGLSNTDRLYQTVPRLLPAYVFSDEVTTPLVRAAHGDSSGVRGAARLWD